MKYRVTVRRVISFSGRRHVTPFARAYCGISLGNRAFTGGRLSALLEWLAAHVVQCRLVVGDDLHRLNLMMNGYSEAAALRESRRLGSEVIGQLSSLMRRLTPGQFVVDRWAAITGSSQFADWSRKVEDLAAENPKFSEGIIASAENFVRRRLNTQPLALPRQDVVALAVRYLLEEISGFAQMSSEGWNIDIYPGPELPILADLIKGKYSAVPKSLLERTNVELRIRQRNKGHSSGEL